MTHKYDLFAIDSKMPVNDLLVGLRPHILMLTYRLPNAKLSYWDCEEITQRVMMKLARILSHTSIVHLHSYLQRSVKHEYIDYLRQHKVTYPLTANDEGEPVGIPLLEISQGMDDPLTELIQKAAFEELLNKLVPLILSLPTEQKRATICHIREKLLDTKKNFDKKNFDIFVALVEKFKRYNVDIDTFSLPTNASERQRLRASYYVARGTLAEKLNIRYIPRQQTHAASVV